MLNWLFRWLKSNPEYFSNPLYQTGGDIWLIFLMRDCLPKRSCPNFLVGVFSTRGHTVDQTLFWLLPSINHGYFNISLIHTLIYSIYLLSDRRRHLSHISHEKLYGSMYIFKYMSLKQHEYDNNRIPSDQIPISYV